jgi:hypothetical protein
MEQQLARDSRMSDVDMRVLHLLEALSEDCIHELGEVSCTGGFAVLVVFFEVVEGVAEVDDELMQKALAHFADLVLNVQQEFPEDQIYGSRVSFVLLGLVLLSVLLPVLLYALYVEMIVLANLFNLAVSLSLLLTEGKKFGQIFFEEIQVIDVLAFISFGYLLILAVTGVVLFAGGNPVGELGLAIVFGLDVGVEGRVAEVGLATAAREVAAVVVIPRAPFPLVFDDVFGVQFVVFRGLVRLAHAARRYQI